MIRSWLTFRNKSKKVFINSCRFSACFEDIEGDDINEENSVKEDPTYEPTPQKSRFMGKYNTMRFDNTVAASVGVSPEKLSEIATSVLKDASKVCPQINPDVFPNMAIGRSKMRHQQNRVFAQLNSQQLPST